MKRSTSHLASVFVRGAVFEARPNPVPGARPIVLLALGELRPPPVAVRRAELATRAVDGTLHVVIALTEPVDDPSAAVSRLVDRVRVLAPASTLDVEVRFGSLRDVASEAALARGAALVILSADAGGTGVAASAIVRQTGISVMVARESRPHGPILAATKLADLRYPVLAASHTLARILSQPVT
mgnify:CR=1 FL=1